MKRYTERELQHINRQLQGIPPEEIIPWIIGECQNPVVTTNFRPYEAAILRACSVVKQDIKVIWCDTGYNTPQTYRHARKIIQQLQLNVKLYIPQHTAAFRNTFFEGVPNVEDPQHEEFTRQVKLEPFQRAMKKEKPDVWFTNLRQGQTSFRDSIGILSYSKDGILKVSPFYHWSDEKLDSYLKMHRLPNEFTYYDPTKALEDRECGLHS